MISLFPSQFLLPPPEKSYLLEELLECDSSLLSLLLALSYPSLWYARLGLNPSWCFLHSFHRQNFIRTVSNYQLHFSKYWDNHKTFPSWGGFLCEDITPNSVGILRRPKMISLFVIKIPVWPRVWRADNFKFNITIKMIVWRSSYSILEYSRAPIWRQ